MRQGDQGQEGRQKGCEMDCGYFLVSGSFVPPANIRQFRDLVRYRWKLTNFIVGEKNLAQNCLTVSNIKLDDVFSDVFGKVSSDIITRMLEHPSEKITDVAGFRTKGMKATDEEVLAAVDSEFCPEQAEKLRIIRSHMNSLELYKLNVESLILSVAKKYIPQIDLVSTVPDIQTFAVIRIIILKKTNLTTPTFILGGIIHPNIVPSRWMRLSLFFSVKGISSPLLLLHICLFCFFGYCWLPLFLCLSVG